MRSSKATMSCWKGSSPQSIGIPIASPWQSRQVRACTSIRPNSWFQGICPAARCGNICSWNTAARPNNRWWSGSDSRANATPSGRSGSWETSIRLTKINRDSCNSKSLSNRCSVESDAYLFIHSSYRYYYFWGSANFLRLSLPPWPTV